LEENAVSCTIALIWQSKIRILGDCFPMRFMIGFFIAILLASGATVAAQDKKPPRRLVFPSKAGDVTFNHMAHLKREKGHCTECHDKLWPHSAKVPVKSSAGCRTCHRVDGKSFEMKGNCIKCHATKGAADRYANPEAIPQNARPSGVKMV